MNDTELVKTIHRTIVDIQTRQGRGLIELRDDLAMINDLGFSSLDLAQLVALLEVKLGLDPFAGGVAVEHLRTVGELCAAYSKTNDEQ